MPAGLALALVLDHLCDWRPRALGAALAIVVGLGCATPFVHLYRPSARNPANYTYPATRKALATFPAASGLALVEFAWGFDLHVGIPVATWAQGDALVAHMKASMAGEEPGRFCFEPTGGRRIELGAKE